MWPFAEGRSGTKRCGRLGDPGLALTGGLMTDLSDNEMVTLFKQHLKLLREGRDGVRAHIAISLEMIERSCALIVQIDEQINRMESELGWVWGLPQSASPSLAPV
jgi:hypothetical protein